MKILAKYNISLDTSEHAHMEHVIKKRVSMPAPLMKKHKEEVEEEEEQGEDEEQEEEEEEEEEESFICIKFMCVLHVCFWMN